MIDSDAYGGTTGGTEVEDCWLTMANPVDLNGYPYVTLEFETQYRSYNSEQCYIVVGIGDGAGNVTWPDLDPTTDISTMTNVFDPFPGYTSGNATTNPELVTVNISSALVGLTPTELADIYIRFHWTGTWGYAWFVDDFSISGFPMGVMGDYNMDLVADIFDLLAIADIILFGGVPTDAQLFFCDLDGSGVIDVMDIINLVSIILDNS